MGLWKKVGGGGATGKTGGQGKCDWDTIYETRTKKKRSKTLSLTHSTEKQHTKQCRKTFLNL